MTMTPIASRDGHSAARGQKSCRPAPWRAVALQRGRGRAAARRAHVQHWTDCPARRRDEFLVRWSRLMIATFSSAADCADWAGVSVQCARWWIDGEHRPCGDVVARAALMLPRFAEIMGGA